MTKQKSCTIRVYSPYGTRYLIADIVARGRVVWTSPHSDVCLSLIGMAAAAAHSMGYNQIKIESEKA